MPLPTRPHVRLDARGHPWSILNDGMELPTIYVGVAEAREALERGSVRPTALTSADFDEDGVPDLVSGYAGSTGGLLVLHRGNGDFLWPNDVGAQARRAAGRLVHVPFWPEASVVELPEPPDFLAGGDFDADGHADVVVAARGGRVLYVLRGDGRGGWYERRILELPGQVTALVVGEMNRADGLEDIVVGIVGREGPCVLVFESPEGAVRREPERIPLPGEATALALGQLDEGFEFDLAIAAGHHLVIVHGRERYWRSADQRSAVVSQIRIDRQLLPSRLIALAVGDFLWDNEQRVEIAALGEDGAVHVLARRPLSDVELVHSSAETASWGVVAAWSDVDLSASAFSHPPGVMGRLVRAKVSSLPSDDLLVLVPGCRRWHILANLIPIEDSAADLRTRALSVPVVMSLDSPPDIVAVLPMRLNSDALSDLVILRDGVNRPSILLTASHATFVVNDTGDEPDANPGNGVCATSAGVCTLRAALQEANAHPGADAIHFNIPGSGPHTIAPTSALPTITEPVTIDATMENACGRLRCVELNGTNAGGNTDGLRIAAGFSVVRGLAINRFRRYGIRLETNGGNVIEGNLIGTDVNGVTDLGNFNDGVRVDEAPNNTIGGTVPSARNIISGNNNDGVEINGSGASGNVVRGNFIGTKANGIEALGNTQRGVFINGAPHTVIGGTVGGARNIISGNRNNDGVEIRGSAASGNLVRGNFIGTDTTGVGSLGNNGHGVYVSASVNTIAGNVIAFNGGDGIFVASGTGNRIQQNAIFSNGGLGIDLGSNGVTHNDAHDPDTGANNLQNFPVLTGVFSGPGTTIVQGSIDSAVGNSAYPILIEFFLNPSCDPSGHGEGEAFIGSTSVNNPGSFTSTLSITVPSGAVMTATATDANGNTSEFSACAVVQHAAELIVRKVMVGGVATFPFTGTPSGSISVNNGTLTAVVAPGTYTSTEGMVSGWDLAGISCDDGDSTWDVNTRTATFQASAGERITCTFTNVRRGQIIVTKNVVPGDASLWQIRVTGQAPQTIGDGGMATFDDLAPGMYTVSESGPSGYAGEVDCGSKGSASGTSHAFALNAGEVVMCAFTNRKFGQIVVRKVTDPSPDPTDTRFSFTGAVTGSIRNGETLTSSPLAPGTYMVTEIVPSAFELFSISCEDKASPHPSTGDVERATATFRLDPGETIVCTFMNRLKRANLTAVAFLSQSEETGGATRRMDRISAEPIQGVIVVDSTRDRVRIFFNQGDGTLRPGQTILVGQEPVAAAAGDLNGDGRADVVTADFQSRALTILEGREDGTFRRRRALTISARPAALALGDFDRDGRLDLVVAYSEEDAVQVFHGRGDLTFAVGRRASVGKRPVALAVADFDRDGILDVVVVNAASDSITVLLGRGDGTFAPGGEVPVDRGPMALAVGDFDGDGRMDVVTANFRAATLSIVRNEGAIGGTSRLRLRIVATMPTGEGPMAVVAERFFTEGVGIAVVGAVAQQVWMHVPEGDRRWSVRQRIPVNVVPGSIASGDLNGDGVPDLVVLDVTGDVLQVWLNNGAGLFRRHP